MKIIAVDFDGCLCSDKWPEIGEPCLPVINELLIRQKNGAKLILWTCRVGERLDAAVRWCAKHGLQFDAVNDNLKEIKEKFGGDTRKVYATEYWDDKNVLTVTTDKGFCIMAPKTDGRIAVTRWVIRDLRPVDRAQKPKKWWQIWR